MLTLKIQASQNSTRTFPTFPKALDFHFQVKVYVALTVTAWCPLQVSEDPQRIVVAKPLLLHAG